MSTNNIGRFPSVSHTPETVQTPPQVQGRWFYNGSGSDIAANMVVVQDLSDTTHGLGQSGKIAPAGGSLGDNADDFLGVTQQLVPDGTWGFAAFGVGQITYVETAAGITAGQLLTTDGAGTAGHMEDIGALTLATKTIFVLAVALEAHGATVSGQTLVRLLGFL